MGPTTFVIQILAQPEIHGRRCYGGKNIHKAIRHKVIEDMNTFALCITKAVARNSLKQGVANPDKTNTPSLIDKFVVVAEYHQLLNRKEKNL